MNAVRKPSLILALLASVAVVGTAYATNNSDATFQQVYDMVDLWLTGSLGKTIAIAALAVGLGIGIVKQSILAVVIGISMALALALGPGVIAGVFSATL